MKKKTKGLKVGLKVVVVEPEGKKHGPDCHCMVCPNCNATEVDDCRKPVDDWKWQIKPFRVDNFSHCMICNAWF
jgi:hypothetical protein